MLVQTELLSEIIEKLENNWVSEEVVIKNYLKKRHKYTHPKIQIKGVLAEIFLNKSLDSICAPYGPLIKRNPIKTGTVINNYFFKVQKSGNLFVSTSEGKLITEYDALILANEVPVIFEIKMSNILGLSNKFKYSSEKNHSNSVRRRYNTMLSQERINSVTQPIKDYYDTKYCSYVLVLPNNQIVEESAAQKEFQELGGILVPFYTDLKSYNVFVKKLIDSYNLLAK